MRTNGDSWTYTVCISEYNSGEDWASYIERMDKYCLANNVDNAVKNWAILLSIVGDKMYKLIQV